MKTVTVIAAALAIAATPAIASAQTPPVNIKTGYSAPHAISHPGCQITYSPVSVAGRIMGVTSIVTYWCPTRTARKGAGDLRHARFTQSATATSWPTSFAFRAL